MLEISRLSPTIGGEVHDVDLAEVVDDDKAIALLREALLEHKVLFFRDQQLTQAQHVAFGRRFGELEVHPFASNAESLPEIMVLDHDDTPVPVGSIRENIWHTDVTWRPSPSMGSILKAVLVPPTGGDTIWSDMYAAYDGLSAGMRASIDGLVAVHDFGPGFRQNMTPEQIGEMLKRFPPVEHPVVRVHPETGRRALFVNDSFTDRILGLERYEGRDLLQFLTRQAARPEYQCRFRWRPGSVAMWDNRCTQHYAVQDYWPQRRRMERVTIIGDRPVGITGT